MSLWRKPKVHILWLISSTLWLWPVWLNIKNMEQVTHVRLSGAGWWTARTQVAAPSQPEQTKASRDQSFFKTKLTKLNQGRRSWIGWWTVKRGGCLSEKRGSSQRVSDPSRASSSWLPSLWKNRRVSIFTARSAQSWSWLQQALTLGLDPFWENKS